MNILQPQAPVNTPRYGGGERQVPQSSGFRNGVLWPGILAFEQFLYLRARPLSSGMGVIRCSVSLLDSQLPPPDK